MMVEQERKYHIVQLPDGREVKANILTEEDMAQRMAEFEAKYGMTSREFAPKWNNLELECTADYFGWAMDCDYMARAHGIEELRTFSKTRPRKRVAEEWKI